MQKKTIFSFDLKNKKRKKATVEQNKIQIHCSIYFLFRNTFFLLKILFSNKSFISNKNKMNPLFNNPPHSRGSSIYNICAPKMVYGSCPGRFTDGYYKQFSTNMGNPMMQKENLGNATPNKSILDSVQGIFMNVLKISPNQQHQMNLRPKEFNFGYQGGPPTPTSPIKIDPKQAGKSFWPHHQHQQPQQPQTPTKSPVDISSFTVISPVSSFLDLETNGSGHNTNTQKESNIKSPPNLFLDLQNQQNHMQTITEEEDKEVKEEHQQENKKMELELLQLKQSKLNAEAKRLKQINKCKHRFNPLRVGSSSSSNKDPIKNIREKWRRNIERDIIEDIGGESACNSSLESLDIEQVHSTDNIARSQAVPIPNAHRRHREFSPEDFPAIGASPLSASAPTNHTSRSLSDFEDDEYIVLDTDAPKSTPTHSPRKSMKICERFNRLFHNHSQSISPGTSPGVSMIPIPRQRTASICSEDSFVVFFDPDRAETAMNDLEDFDDEDETDDSDSESESEVELPPTSDEEDDDENNNSHVRSLGDTVNDDVFKDPHGQPDSGFHERVKKVSLFTYYPP